MPVDPRSLSAFRSAPVEGDVACFKCGYNLKGLARGGNCPECGAPVSRSIGRGRFLYKNLTDAPLGYLKLLRLGFFLLAGVVVGLLVAVVVAFRMGGLSASLLVAGLSVAWWGGVYLVTTSEYPPGELHRLYDRLRWLRWANRVLQASWGAAWALSAVQILLMAQQNSLVASGATEAAIGALDVWIRAAGLASFVLQIIGLASLIPLCIHFAEIAGAAGDNSLETRLGLAAWGIAIFGSFLVAAVALGGAGALGQFFLLGFGLMTLGLLATVGLFVWCLIELAIMCGWAVVNSRNATARDQRLLERAQREEAARQARLATLPPLERFERPAARVVDDAPIPLEPER